MKKTYVYEVTNSGYEFRGDSAWGEAWKQAKEKAAELHEGIVRTVIWSKGEQHEYFAKGGVFLNVKFYKENNLKIF